ncbi:MAG: hypothetical protein ACOX4V_03355 [Anaerovoracaceae bacterium]|jgi:hypothetical protein|nr:hypothetical protein [Clostridiales bacterium]
MTMKKNFDPQCITFSQMNMIFNARTYYRRLTTWSREYINSRYYGVNAAADLFSRLYFESLEIGNMLEIIFGREISEKYSQYLSQYAITLYNLISAQLDGDTEAVNRYVEQLYENVAQRAAFLETVNPFWDEFEYYNLLGTYTHYIIELANALAANDINRIMELYDLVKAHTNLMGDVFAQGLYDYITSGVQIDYGLENVECVTYDQINTIYEIRMFWFELVTWVRIYMLSIYLEIGDSEIILTRLRQVPVDYINVLRRILGDQISDDYIDLFNIYIDLIVAFIDAQIEGNIEEINRLTQLFYENEQERAAFLAAINPFWEERELRNRLRNLLHATIDESTTFLSGDYARNVDIFSRILAQAESMSNYLAQGLFNYINYIQEDSLDI